MIVQHLDSHGKKLERLKNCAIYLCFPVDMADDDGTSAAPSDTPHNPDTELPQISHQLSGVPPPSPGSDNFHFANGTLGDIMAAEFRDLSSSPKDPPSTPVFASDPDQASHSQEIEPLPEEPPAHNHVQNSGEFTHVKEADRPVSLSTTTTSVDVNEIESQSLGPSILGGDDLYTAVAFGDGESHSRQRILSFAAKRCENAVQRNPQDYDALYNWALVLQETADILDGDNAGAMKDRLLEEACAKYKAATDLCPTLHEAFYNWAIAISDRAKARGRFKEAEELWKESCKRYERAVQLNRNSPQAFNNWGLALQELSGIVQVKDKRAIVETAIKKFRAAIALQFDFHRAIYNLGTVLYGLAEDTVRAGSQQSGMKKLTATELYSQSAIYVAAAHALKPEYPVYKSALRLVRSKLPLAYLKTGYLSVPPQGDSFAPHSDWRRLWFVLDHEAFYQVDKTFVGSSESNQTRGDDFKMNDNVSNADSSYSFRIEVSEICGLNACSDLSLPPGAGFCIDTVHSQQYLIADTWDEVDCWVDAIRLVYTIYSRGQSDVLGGIIAG